MDKAKIIENIIKTLENFYTPSFNVADLLNRHYDFSSGDYDFSFPSNIASGLTEESLQNKFERFLKINSDAITKNEHFLFDEYGKVRTN